MKKPSRNDTVKAIATVGTVGVVCYLGVTKATALVNSYYVTKMQLTMAYTLINEVATINPDVLQQAVDNCDQALAQFAAAHS